MPALLTPSFSSSISAQSNFAVGAVVNATFGSITELTFYITALIKGSREGNRCYAEIVKSALTGTLVGCVLFVPVSHGVVPSWHERTRSLQRAGRMLRAKC